MPFSYDIIISALTKKWQGKSQYGLPIWAVSYRSEEGEKHEAHLSKKKQEVLIQVIILKMKGKQSCSLTLRRRIKSHLLFAGIIRSSPFSLR